MLPCPAPSSPPRQDLAPRFATYADRYDDASAVWVIVCAILMFFMVSLWLNRAPMCTGVSVLLWELEDLRTAEEALCSQTSCWLQSLNVCCVLTHLPIIDGLNSIVSFSVPWPPPSGQGCAQRYVVLQWWPCLARDAGCVRQVAAPLDSGPVSGSSAELHVVNLHSTCSIVHPRCG